MSSAKQLLWNGSIAQDFEIIDILGKGQYGAVYKATLKRTNDVYALKKVTFQNAEAKADIVQEADILFEAVSNEFVVGYFGRQEQGNEMWLVLEFCGVGSLLDIMKGIKRPFNDEEIAVVTFCVVHGLCCLHDALVLHRDVKPDNILVNEKGQAKLADLGISARAKTREDKRKTVIGTSHYLAPEIILGEGYDFKVDIWSLGLSLIELVDQRHPYDGQDAFRVMYLISSAPSPVAANATPALAEVIAMCLVKKAAQRASAADLTLERYVATAARKPCLDVQRLTFDRTATSVGAEPTPPIAASSSSAASNDTAADTPMVAWSAAMSSVDTPMVAWSPTMAYASPFVSPPSTSTSTASSSSSMNTDDGMNSLRRGGRSKRQPKEKRATVDENNDDDDDDTKKEKKEKSSSRGAKRSVVTTSTTDAS